MTSPAHFLALCLVINGLILADSFRSGSALSTAFSPPSSSLPGGGSRGRSASAAPLLTPRRSAPWSGPITAEATDSAFEPLPDSSSSQAKAGDDDADDDTLEKVELLGRGAAKTKRGKRKLGTASAKAPTAKVSLAPEEVFYEGPPAISETIVPTASILTVIGVIPAAAAWARQAWVRYRITTRRIRCTSGIGGKDMAEIVYPDIVELRTAKRLFGDGDLVAFLRDGAKFEMRNIPNFDETIEFILKQVNPDVAKQYRAKGDVASER